MAIVESGKDCPDFMKSEVYGTIGFYQGNKNRGYVHILTHEPDKDTGKPNHQDMLKDGNIPNTLAFGGYYPDGRDVVVKHGNKYVVLAQGRSGWYIRTAYIDYTGVKARLFPPTRHKVENKKDGGDAF